jgi:hypothetical protein
MRIPTALLVMVLLLMVAVAQASVDGVDDCTQSMFADLLARSVTQGPEREAAAFLVVTEEGMRCVLWPHDSRSRKQGFRGSIPAGTVAIAHTHPDRTELREPSAMDRLEARRLGMPIYVVTNWTIWVAEPARGNPVQIAYRWRTAVSRVAKTSCGCRPE